MPSLDDGCSWNGKFMVSQLHDKNAVALVECRGSDHARNDHHTPEAQHTDTVCVTSWRTWEGNIGRVPSLPKALRTDSPTDCAAACGRLPVT